VSSADCLSLGSIVAIGFDVVINDSFGPVLKHGPRSFSDK